MPVPCGIIVYVTVGEQEPPDLTTEGVAQRARDSTTFARRRRRRRSAAAGPDRVFLIVMTVILLGVLAVLPMAQKVDSLTDRKRPMYFDVEWLAWMEYHQVLQHGFPRPVHAAGGQTVKLGGLQHTISPGVRAHVHVRTHSYCIRARNQYGDRSERVCYRDKAIPYNPSSGSAT